MVPRYFKSFKLNSSKKCDIEYGVVNRKTPEVVFITCKTYISSLTSQNLTQKVNDILTKAKKIIITSLKDSRFKNEFIYDFNLTQDLEPNFKNKIVTLDFFIKQKHDNIIVPSDLQSEISCFINPLIDYLDTACYNNKILLSKRKQK